MKNFVLQSERSFLYFCLCISFWFLTFFSLEAHGKKSFHWVFPLMSTSLWSRRLPSCHFPLCHRCSANSTWTPPGFPCDPSCQDGDHRGPSGKTPLSPVFPSLSSRPITDLISALLVSSWPPLCFLRKPLRSWVTVKTPVTTLSQWERLAITAAWCRLVLVGSDVMLSAALCWPVSCHRTAM